MPLRGDAKAMTVNWLMIEILDADGEVTYRNSFITDMAVNRENVAELAACGRARWKIENEGFNTLKTKGYHLEHNFGHGQQNLSAVLATLNLLAFACHTVCDLGGRAWKAARRELVTRQGFFHCHAGTHLLSGVPVLGSSARNARLHAAAAARAVNRRHKKCQPTRQDACVRP